MITNTILEKSKYEKLLLGTFVEYQPVTQMKISVTRVDENETNKEVTLSNGDKVEIIYIDKLDLRYGFGRVVRLYDTRDVIILDMSDGLQCKIQSIAIGNIRDIEIFNGTFVLYPDNNIKDDNNSSSVGSNDIINNYI